MPVSSPEPLARAATLSWQRFFDGLGPDLQTRTNFWLAARPDGAIELARTFALSEFAAAVATAQPEAFVDFLESNAFEAAPAADFVGESLRCGRRRRIAEDGPAQAA